MIGTAPNPFPKHQDRFPGIDRGFESLFPFTEFRASGLL